MSLLTQNRKMKRSQKDGIKLFNFGIPTSSCIGAAACLKYCYAKKGAYTWPNVKNAYEIRLGATKANDFSLNMLIEIIEKEATHIRIHDSGDFYSREYLYKWIKVIEALPHVVFYCYTKSIPLFLNEKMPENFHVIFSYGGKYDYLIDKKKHGHSIVSDKIEKNYIDASFNDLALIGEKRIGLLKH